MPINVRDTEEKVTKKLSSIPLLNKIIRNPLFTALAIVIVFILIILFVFRNSEIYTDEDTPGLCRLSLRAGFYAFIVTAGLVFLNNYYLKEEFKSNSVSGAMEAIFDGVDTISTNGNNGESVINIMSSPVAQSAKSDAGLSPVSVTIPNYKI